MKSIENFVPNFRSAIDNVVSIVKSDPRTPTTERELMNIGTIRDLYTDGRTPVSVVEDGQIMAIVPTSEREIKNGAPEFFEIPLLPGQDVLLQEAIAVEKLRDSDIQKLADL